MFDHTSRYYHIETATLVTPDGKRIAYKRRRLLPKGEKLRRLMDVTVKPGDRLDLVTARALGRPELFWRVCDANNAMDPFELVSEPNRVLRIPQPQHEAS